MRIAIACLLFSAACVDTADKPDEETQSTTTQAASIWDECRVGDGYSNALVYEPPDSYTRTANTINNVCHCDEWQEYKHDHGNNEDLANAAYPDCRPQTIADFSLHEQQLGYRLVAEVPTWHNIADKTECENSTLFTSVQQWTGSGYVQLFPSGSSPAQTHPVWNNGTCQPVSWSSGQVVPGLNVQLRAKAIRGLAQYDHGYDGVKLYAIPY